MTRLSRLFSAILGQFGAAMAGVPDYVSEIEQIVETEKTVSNWLNSILAGTTQVICLRASEPELNSRIADQRVMLLKDLLSDQRDAERMPDDEDSLAYLAVTRDREHTAADLEKEIGGMERVAELYGREEVDALFRDGPREILAGRQPG